MRVLIRILCFAMLFSIVVSAGALEQWLYLQQNLWVDKNIDEMETLFVRAGKAGYTHVMIADSKSAKLGDMDARYFRNVERVKKIAAANGLQIVPTVFPIGYSNDILWHDPNLIEALPVRDALFVVQNGEARLEADVRVELKGGDFSDFKLWGWHDPNVLADNGAALIKDPKGANARISQKVKLTPFRQYHISVRVKTADFRGTPEVKVLVENLGLNHNALGTKPTQDWTVHHVIFNSLSNREAQIYFGVWGGKNGSLWFDDAKLEEVGLVNLVRREGAPFVARLDPGKRADPVAERHPEIDSALPLVGGAAGVLIEGRDFERVVDTKMGVKPWKGSYDIYHEPPAIKTRLSDGTKLRISYFHAATVHEDQANICPSEPKTIELLRDQAKRVHAAWGAKGYMMSHDEIRVLNWCDACQKRGLDAGALLADNVRTCTRILREVNPSGRIYVWSDMFDPNHNAKKDYYLVRGDLKGSWEGLDKDIIVVPWYFEKRAESLKFFADRGHHQVIAGYYDHRPEQIADWLQAARSVANVDGVMYTTWKREFKDLERFSDVAQSKNR